ncbi:MAG TPA: hypothetical protein PKC28_01640 [Bdellovibrionales bacterium]|nr:hypothetical protein [Bdellovibrionales bacterium]
MQKLLVGTGLLVLLLAFQNCSLEPEHSGSSSSRGPASFAAGCDSSLKKVYFETYYNSFRNNCVSCHADKGESGRYFASSDFDTAFSYFNTIGRLNVERKAIDAGHKPPRTGPQHAAMIAAFKPAWDAAEVLANDCKLQNRIQTTQRAAPNTVYTTAPNDGANWPQLVYNLKTDIVRADLQGKLELEVSLEVRRYRPGGVDSGYEFRRPRVRILDDGDPATPLKPYRLKGLNVSMNGMPLTTLTLFGSLDYEALTGTAAVMMPGTGYAFVLATVSGTNQFSLTFDEIQTSDGSSAGNPGGGGGGGGMAPPPAKVTHADLISSNAMVNVFEQSCRSCHNATTASGGLNVLDYAQARDASANIKARMNDFAKPMPPAGILSLERRAIVDVWISSGTPQN